MLHVFLNSIPPDSFSAESLGKGGCLFNLHACMHACVRACVRACMCVCVCVCVLLQAILPLLFCLSASSPVFVQSGHSTHCGCRADRIFPKQVCLLSLPDARVSKVIPAQPLIRFLFSHDFPCSKHD